MEDTSLADFSPTGRSFMDNFSFFSDIMDSEMTAIINLISSVLLLITVVIVLVPILDGSVLIVPNRRSDNSGGLLSQYLIYQNNPETTDNPADPFSPKEEDSLFSSTSDSLSSAAPFDISGLPSFILDAATSRILTDAYGTNFEESDYKPKQESGFFESFMSGLFGNEQEANGGDYDYDYNSIDDPGYYASSSDPSVEQYAPGEWVWSPEINDYVWVDGLNSFNSGSDGNNVQQATDQWNQFNPPDSYWGRNLGKRKGIASSEAKDGSKWTSWIKTSMKATSSGFTSAWESVKEKLIPSKNEILDWLEIPKDDKEGCWSKLECQLMKIQAQSNQTQNRENEDSLWNLASSAIHQRTIDFLIQKISTYKGGGGENLKITEFSDCSKQFKKCQKDFDSFIHKSILQI